MSPVDLTRPAAPSPDPGGRKLTGGMVLAMLVAFFGVIITVNVVMMRFAISTLPGEVTGSSYESSQTFNKKVIAAAQAQEERHWAVDGSLKRTSADNCAVDVSVKNASGTPETGLAMRVVLEHPSDRRLDRTVEASEAGQGNYHADFAGVPAGGRNLIIEARRGDEVLYRSVNRVNVP